MLIEPQVFGDARGFFLETWQAEKFAAAGIDATFVQDNHSRSSQWTLRGLHLQVEHTQGKLVRVTSGSVFDVIVDLRRSSPSFGAWWGVELSAENHRMLWVPPGLAHGILVTSEFADFLYKCTDFYSPAHERTLAWNDPKLGDSMAAAAGNRTQALGEGCPRRELRRRSRNSHESAGARRRRPGRESGALRRHRRRASGRAQDPRASWISAMRRPWRAHSPKSVPSWVVNGAAYTAVDLAEDQPAQAMAVNDTAVGVLASGNGAARAAGCCICRRISCSTASPIARICRAIKPIP